MQGNSFLYSSWFWIFILSLPLIFIHVSEAEGLEKREIDDLIDAAKIKIVTLTDDIAEQNKIIAERQNKIDELERQEKEDRKKENKNWTDILTLLDLEVEINSVKNSYQDARDELKKLLQQRSDEIKQVKKWNLLLASQPEPSKSIIVTNQDKKIGVRLSDTCKIMIKNNFTTNCPDYKRLVQLDSSNTDISGKFGTVDNFFHRKPAPVAESWKWYDGEDRIRLFVDPPTGMIERIKMVTIVPNLDTYKSGFLAIQPEFELVDATVNKTIGNTTKAIPYQFLNQTESFARILYHNWYINDCRTAVVSANGWQEYLPIVLYELRNNCPEEFVGQKEIIKINATVIDITTSPNYQAQQKLNESIIKCKGLCFEY